MPPFESLPQADLSTFAVRVNGSNALVDYQVEYIDVRHSINKIAYAEISLIDGDAAQQTFALSESDKLAVGSTIAIDLGFNNNNTTVFDGVIVSQKVKVTQQGYSRTILHCKHPSYVLAESEQTRYFSDINAPDLIKQICSEFGLNMNLESNQVYTIYEQLCQFRQTPWDFIGALATRNNLMLNCTGNSLSLIEYDQGLSNPITNSAISFGVNVLEADLELDIRGQFASIESKTWSPSEQTFNAAQTTASSSQLGNQAQGDLAKANGNIAHKATYSKEIDQSHLDILTKSIATQQTLKTIVGTIGVLGQSSLHIGESVAIEGFGARFNGQAWVSGLMHSLSRGQWTSTIQVGLPQNAIDVFTPNETSPSIHIGKVVGLEGDDTSGQRIRVDLVIADGETEGIWARMASQDAGDSRGAMFIPNIGDEVVLSFIDHDPSQVLILGSLHSAAQPRFDEVSDANAIRGWKTPSEMAFVFNEDTKSITLSTPEGNELTLNEDAGGIEVSDQNGNKIVLDGNGIAIDSAVDLSIKCSGNFSLEASNIEIKGSGSTSVQGSSSAEFKSSGSLTINGSIVQIN